MQVYVTTYAKYNNGSLSGRWIDASDKDSFFEECKELHADESDPELMFQDFDGVPMIFVGECYISEKFWDFLEYDEYDQAKILAYAENMGGLDFDFDHAIDNVYLYNSTSERELAWDWCDQLGVFSEVPDHLSCYFDHEQYFKDNGPSFVKCADGYFLFSE